MAVTYPCTLLTDDETSAGEVKVFEAIHEQLDDRWEAFHSVGLLRTTPKGTRDGEIDFVLAHPDRGIIVLEVKGGDIECRYGEWQRRLDKRMTRVKDPVAQAVEQKHELLRLIDGVDGWSRHDLLVGHAIGLPDVSVHSLALPPNLAPEIVIDSTSMPDLFGALERVVDFHRGGTSSDHRRPPGKAGMEMLRDLLAPELELHVGLADHLREDDRALVRLTRDQSLLLAHMSDNPFMAISGCAGSGKTMLAVEHALRLAQDGQRVLFLCFNKALGAWLEASYSHPNIDFTHFHRLCFRHAKKHGIVVPEYPEGKAPPKFWSDELPDAFVAALEVSGPQWDALIVDEAQDLNDTWLTALRMGLRDEEASPVWLFFDDNQRVYDTGFTIPHGFLRFSLKTNCRNTQAIHQELLKLYTGGMRPDVKGPPGRAPELVQTDDQPTTVAGILDRLTSLDKIAPADIVVLSSHGRDNSRVAQALANRLVFEPPKPNDNRIRFSSIRGFKGLESAVIVLCELEDIDEHTRDMQLYVGMSRARTHCVLVAPPRGS